MGGPSLQKRKKKKEERKKKKGGRKQRKGKRKTGSENSTSTSWVSDSHKKWKVRGLVHMCLKVLSVINTYNFLPI